MKVKVLFIFFCVIYNLTSAETFHDKYNKRTFDIENVEGWTFYINQDIKKEKIWPTAKRILSNQLFSMKLLLKDQVIKDMQKVKIYVDIRQKGKSGAEYHPSKQWLINNKFSPNKAQTVEYSNLKGILSYNKTQPWVMLHELIHAYHHQVLGFDHKGIKDCYDKAMKSGKYAKVLHINGRTVKHYATTDHKEYFSEAAEAYFGVNDFYPFTKAELMKFDPDIYKIVKTLAK